MFKSLKLWSFYVDLVESLGTIEEAKAVYDKIMELRIANAQIIVNYAAFLEENEYFEESFRVYERGVELFTYPVSFEIWNIYLGKFVKRYVSLSVYIRDEHGANKQRRVEPNWSARAISSNRR